MKDGLFWLTIPGDTVHHDRESVVPAAVSTWTLCVHSQEAESDECLYLDYILLILSRTSACGMIPLTFMMSLPVSI